MYQLTASEAQKEAMAIIKLVVQHQQITTPGTSNIQFSSEQADYLLDLYQRLIEGFSKAQ